MHAHGVTSMMGSAITCEQERPPLSKNVDVSAAPTPTRVPQGTSDPQSAPTVAQSWLGVALLTLAAGVAALSLLGPLVTGAINYRISDLILSQLIGLDAVSLVLVAPLATLAGVLTLGRHPLGPVLALGPTVYVAYMTPQYILGPDYLNLTGNNERFFGLLLALFVLGVCGAITAWAAIDLPRLPVSSARERLVGRVLLPIAAVLVFVRYLPGLADWMSAEPTAKDYLAGPIFAWTIALLDLGLALPASVAVCIGVHRGARWARKGLYTIVAWYALVGSAVAAMAISMYARDDATMSVAQMAIMSVLGAALVALAMLVYAPLLRRRGGALSHRTRS
jgi:hypothetical protein